MSFEKLLNKLCTIQSKTESQTGLGEITASWANKATNVPTRYRKLKEPVQVDGSFQITIEDYKFSFTMGVDVQLADRIVVDGSTYEIIHVRSDSSDHHQTVYGRIVKFD